MRVNIEDMSAEDLFELANLCPTPAFNMVHAALFIFREHASGVRS